jgi:hypothetical protein
MSFDTKTIQHTVRRSHKAIVGAFESYQSIRDGVAESGRYTGEGAREAIAEQVARAGLPGIIDTAVADAARVAGFAENDAAAVRARFTDSGAKTDSQQVAYELKAQRVWGRWLRELDAKPGYYASETLLDAIRRADPIERSVLLTEAPAYLRARGEDDLRFDRDVDRTLAEADPEYGAAVAVRDWAGQAASEVKSAARAVGDALEGHGRSDDGIAILLGAGSDAPPIPDPPAGPAETGDAITRMAAEITSGGTP